MIEICNAGKADALADDEAQDFLAARAQDLPSEHSIETGDHGLEGEVVGVSETRQPAEQRRDRAEHDLLEQILLVLERQVNGALGDPGFLGDVVEPSGREAFCGEDFEPRIEDQLPPHIGCRLAAC